MTRKIQLMNTYFFLPTLAACSQLLPCTSALGVVSKINSPLAPKDKVYFGIIPFLCDPYGVIPQTPLVFLSTICNVNSLIKPKENS